MAFGQQSGPPASHREVAELLSLLQEAGHADFRDARGPMGFTQRQAAGKFTRDEVAAFIGQLREAAEGSDGAAAEPAPTPAAKRTPRQAAAVAALRTVPAEALAAELQRRGWAVLEP